jgi:hypothetical protein
MREDRSEYNSLPPPLTERAASADAARLAGRCGTPRRPTKREAFATPSVDTGSRLLWRLLRQHVSLPQLAAFFMANLLGMFIVMLGCQCYRDVRPLFASDDGILQAQYVIIHKPVSSMSALGMGQTATFSEEEIRQIEAQSFCRRVGRFSASQYDVYCRIAVKGMPSIGTEMFFESVPDGYIDTPPSDWKFDPSAPAIPIILPRSYLALYNFGFAQTRSLPKLSEGVVGMIELDVTLSGGGRQEKYSARVVGFSSRLNTILVPESFMQWSNERLGGVGEAPSPSRLILEVTNPADDSLVTYLNEQGYETENDQQDAGRAMYVVRLLVAVVVAVGVLICALSFYLLLLSIYLLVEKNTDKLHNLLLIGYSPARTARPYQLLSAGVSLGVWVLAAVLLILVRRYYMNLLWSMFPRLTEGSVWPVLLLGFMLLLAASILNAVVIRRRIIMIWKNKH